LAAGVPIAVWNCPLQSEKVMVAGTAWAPVPELDGVALAAEVLGLLVVVVVVGVELCLPPVQADVKATAATVTATRTRLELLVGCTCQRLPTLDTRIERVSGRSLSL